MNESSKNIGVLGIHWWYQDGIRHFRCRGIGPRYIDFYRWVNTLASYRCTSVDWPWDFFVITDPEEEETMFKKFGEDIIEDKDE